MELEAERDSNQIELIGKVVKDLEAERDSLLLEVSKLSETAKFQQNSEDIKESS